MSNKQQTAVEWLIENLENYNTPSCLSLDWDIFYELCDQAKEMEKERMIEFTDDFWFYCVNRDGSIKITPEQYYNETYGGNK